MNHSIDMSRSYDVVIIGAGAAGLFCAAQAGQRGRRVLVLDHANKVGKKILMSGGGRCNFTNLYTTPEHFFSANPHFCKSALKRYTPYDFLALVQKHGVEYVDKDEGQLFCKHKANDILQMLLQECADGGVKIRSRCHIIEVRKTEGFVLDTSDGEFRCESLVVATGGLSIPTLGASGFGYELAQQFGLKTLATSAALVPFTLPEKRLRELNDLSGLSLPVTASCNRVALQGDMLFTHRGLSGPVMLQLSCYWSPGNAICIDLSPQHDLFELLPQMKQQHAKMDLHNVLSNVLPKRLAIRLCELWQLQGPINQFSDKQLRKVAERFHRWSMHPSGTEGYRTAEVTMGGVDTDDISSKTMQAKQVPGLYFIGEVLDVTGQLGGFNFQWAWASAWAAAQYV